MYKVLFILAGLSTAPIEENKEDKPVQDLYEETYKEEEVKEEAVKEEAVKEGEEPDLDLHDEMIKQIERFETIFDYEYEFLYKAELGDNVDVAKCVESNANAMVMLGDAVDYHADSVYVALKEEQTDLAFFCLQQLTDTVNEAEMVLRGTEDCFE